MSAPNGQDETFLLVSGTMRSGTTLLGELLYSRKPLAQRHPQLAFDNDRVVTLRNLSRRLHRAGGIALEDPVAAVPFSTPVIAQHFGAARDLTEPQACTLLGRRLREEILSFAPSAEPPRVIGLKSTHLFTEVDLLRRPYPRVQMIVMVRDPRDVLASHHGRLAKRHAARVINRILLTALSYHYFLLARDGDPGVQAMRYEDLVSDPVSHLRRLLDAAGLDPERYDWGSLAAGRVSSNSSWNRGEGVAMIADTGISKASVGAYRNRLTEFQIAAVELLLAPLMRRFGYPAGDTPSTALQARFVGELLPELYQDAFDHHVSVGPLETRLREMKLEAAIAGLPRSRWRPGAVARRATELGRSLILAGRKKLLSSPR